MPTKVVLLHQENSPLYKSVGAMAVKSEYEGELTSSKPTDMPSSQSHTK